MLSAVAADSVRGDHLGDLVAAVRPEFCGEVIAVSPEDPVFGRGRCAVLGCGRSAWARDLCSAHHRRWANHGEPDLGEFKAGAAAVAVRAGSENVDGFDLSALAVGARLEAGYVLQCRHDDRTVRVPPSAVRHLVALLVNSGAGSLLGRPLEHWLDEVRVRGLKDPSRTIGLVRYAYRSLSDLGGIDIEAEYASDVWGASRLGIKVTRSPAQTRFDTIEQPWLRAAVKRWARLRPGVGQDFRQRARRCAGDAVVQPIPRPTRSPSRRRGCRHPRRGAVLPGVGNRLTSCCSHLQHLHHVSAGLSRRLPTPRPAAPAAVRRQRSITTTCPADPGPCPGSSPSSPWPSSKTPNASQCCPTPRPGRWSP